MSYHRLEAWYFAASETDSILKYSYRALANIICQKGDEETWHVIGSRHHLFTKNNHKCSVQEGKRRVRSDFQQWQPFFFGANLYQIHVFKFSVPVTIPSLCFFD